jgi:hypothetical protein
MGPGLCFCRLGNLILLCDELRACVSALFELLRSCFPFVHVCPPGPSAVIFCLVHVGCQPTPLSFVLSCDPLRGFLLCMCVRLDLPP